jgi:AraC-like DNA-binding protein
MRQWVAASVSGRLFHAPLLTPLGRITWAGRHLDLRPRRPMPMRYWDTYSAVYVLKGRGRFRDQGGFERDVGSGDLMLMFPRRGYRYLIDPEEPWSEFFIQFRGPLFSLWKKEGLLDPGRPVHHLDPVDHWWRRLEAIIRPSALPEPAQSLKRICQLQDFLVDAVVASRGSPAAGAESAWCAKACALIEKDLGARVDWQALAGRLDLSYHRFRKVFADRMGVPPAKYRAAKAIERAEDLLADRSLPIKRIASLCGFCDAFHFAKRFKAATGLTPAQARRRGL